MKRDAISINSQPGSVRIAWSMFGGQLELKLLITLLVGSPIICTILLSMTQLAWGEALACVGVTALLGVVIWLLVSGTIEILLDEHGLTRTVRKPLRIVTRQTTPGPIEVRFVSLFGTSVVPNGTPTQFGVVFAPVDGAFSSIENIVLFAADAARLKEALTRAAVPGVTLQQDVNIEDESRPDCRVCGYDLVGSAAAGRCPECGELIEAGHQRVLARLHALRHGQG